MMDVVPVPLAPLLRQEIIVHHQFIVLAVDRQHAPMPGNLPHEVFQAPGVDFGDRCQARLPPFGGPDVGRKDFDAGEARRDELMVPGDGVGGCAVGVDTMGGIVRIRLAAPGRQVVVDPLGQVPRMRYGRKIDHRRRPAPDGPQGVLQRPGVGHPGHQRPGAGLDVGDGMGVGLDAAGHDNLPMGIDDLRRRGRQQPRKCHGHDLLALDPYVPVSDPGRGDDATSLNEHVEHG